MNKIDKFYHINLAKRTDRNNNMIKQFNKANIPINMIERFEAIDGNTYIFSDIEKNLFKNCDYKDQSFATKIMGNQLSHHNIMIDMIIKNYNYIVIMQDDSIFCDNFLLMLNNIMTNLPDNAEMVNIGYHKYAASDNFIGYELNNVNDYELLGNNKINEYICELKNDVNTCSLAYILTLEGAKNIVTYFEVNGFLKATDKCFNDYLKSKNIFYGSTHVLVTGDPKFGSDIFNKKKKKSYHHYINF
jgi:GR25 family glycosyltransferase involved in LPS biosynthesis